jgi:hypothetical protein
MYLNMEFFNKQNFKNFLHKQYHYIFVLLIFGIILTHKTISPLYTPFLIIGLMYYSYFIHILLHIIPEKYNPHLAFHHNIEQNSTKNGRIISFIIESFFVNVGMFLLLYYFQILIKYELFPPILIMYYGTIYITVHNINYSILHIGNHEKHHLGDKGEITTNFGPDTLDHFLGTNQDSVFEHMYHNIPNIIFAFLLTALIFCNKNDIL